MNTERVASVINEWDPIDLMSFSPTDEYEVEIKMISEKMDSCSTAEELAREIHDIFQRQFRTQFDKSLIECLEIAEKLMGR
ncbi:DUF1871 family protein [Sulfoacidibacillus thermotolerans]|uniref:DUF1871 domain-containing protein n=1 Tax=Sulfoacidibacillus thermotolerans TaxID=1765684 RepID=A0A2U3D936_SULT2|nr:DUF1871 family protein [Sulfoacidibacillus thermotolerans]PWI57781.1 hypothetical protein BM613_07315 [Sulfoacidibacillus thermotolerans]